MEGLMTNILHEDQIYIARLITLKKALLLETKGMKRRGRSVYTIIKSEFGLRGNKQSVYTQFCELVEKKKGEI